MAPESRHVANQIIQHIHASEGTTMQLFAWQPQDYGPLSFFVMATDETAARQAVDAFIHQHQDDDRPPNSRGWGTKAYQLTVAGPGQVLINANE